MKEEQRKAVLKGFANRMIGAYQVVSVMVLEQPELHEFGLRCVKEFILHGLKCCRNHGFSKEEIDWLIAECEAGIKRSESLLGATLVTFVKGGEA